MDNIANNQELKELSALCRRKLEADQEVESLEKRLKDAKDKARRITEIDIPEKMMTLGISQLRLDSGEVVSIDTFYSCSIPESAKVGAYTWLEENGYGALIKGEFKISTKKGETELKKKAIEVLNEAGLPYTFKESVHPMTLKSFVREYMDEGKMLPSDLFNVHIGNRAKITT